LRGLKGGNIKICGAVWRVRGGVKILLGGNYGVKGEPGGIRIERGTVTARGREA